MEDRRRKNVAAIFVNEITKFWANIKYEEDLDGAPYN